MNRRRTKWRWEWMILLMLLLSSVPCALAQMASSDFQVSPAGLSNGGGTGSSTNYQVDNTAGQAATSGVMESPSFGVSGGFQAAAQQEAGPTGEPRIRLSIDVLEFGEVSVGHSSNQILTIHNDGEGGLQVTQISADDPQFTCSPEQVNIPRSVSADVTITFAPESEGTFEATLTILCNDPLEPECHVTLSGIGVPGGCAGGVVGDVNGDASINVLDVLAVVNDILGIVPLDENGECRADCNGDGAINVLDALGIVNVILGITPNCPGSTAKIAVHPEAMKFLESLELYFSAIDFARFMGMAREVQLPAEYDLLQNYPNPFNPVTTIQYAVGSGQLAIQVTLKIFNVLGQEVATLVDGVKDPGYYTVTWDASQVPSGVYLCRIVAGNFTATRRMVLMK